MEANFYDGEQPQNFEQKCPVCFVIDRSGSMSGTPIDNLNDGLKVFEQQISNDTITASRLDISIVSFGSDTKLERDFGLIDEAEMPIIGISGSTRLVDGVRHGIKQINERKAWYKSTGQTYYRPYLILMTDGGPDSDQDVDGLANEIKQLANNKNLNFWPIGVQGADMNMLAKIAVPGVGASLPPMMLDGLNFVELFKFLSASFSKISKSKEGEKVDITPKKENNPFQFTV